MRKKRDDCILGPLWIDYDFDQNDQLARKYLKYQGKYYDVGTIVKIKGDMKKEALAEFKGWHYNNHGNFKSLDGGAFDIWDNYNFSAANKYIIEIVTPVYPQLETKIVAKGDDREKPPSWTVEVDWIWYIVIMIALAFFKARWLGWIAATVIFLDGKVASSVIRKNKCTTIRIKMAEYILCASGQTCGQKRKMGLFNP